MLKPKRSWKFLMWLSLVFLLLSGCRVVTGGEKPIKRAPPSVVDFRLVISQNNPLGEIVTSNSRRPILLYTSDAVSWYVKFSSSSTLRYVDITLISENGDKTVHTLSCNRAYECRASWDLSAPLMVQGYYSLSLEAENLEGKFSSLPDDYLDVILVRDR